jgi:hypothetical protein
MGSFYVASYGSQGYGGGILACIHTGPADNNNNNNNNQHNTNHHRELISPHIESQHLWMLTSIYMHCFIRFIRYDMDPAENIVSNNYSLPRERL